MTRLIEAETATPQLQAVHAVMCGEPDSRATWQFVADICEANPGNGIATILCARAAEACSRGFVMGQPLIGSQRMAE
jgi:hypothetical protein